MSGYLEVKYPFKSNLGLNPFKSWKRQWCILRPSPTCSGGSLAVYCSEAGATAGTIDLPSGCIVRRAKSRTRPYAFAVFPIDDHKPRVLLAAHSLQEAHLWMEKIKALLNGNKLLGTETLLKDSYSVTVVPTDLSHKCGMTGDGVLTVSSTGVCFTRTQKLGTFVEWKHINDVQMSSEGKNRTCVLTVDREYSAGGGELKLSTPLASDVCAAVSRARRDKRGKLSRSDGDLRGGGSDTGEIRRSSWYSGPSEVSLDDIDLVMSKESQRPPAALSRCAAAGHLAPRPLAPRPRLHTAPSATTTTCDDSMSDRRSLLSIASGIYEEIPDLPEAEPADTYCAMGGPAARRVDEPTYESVADCVYATMRRTGKRHPPPPLPPRVPFGPPKLDAWGGSGSGGGGGGGGGAEGVTRHSSLGSLPRCCQLPRGTHTLPHKNKAFSVFRKRLKSDSRLATSPKSDTAKENKDVETKKKKFDFTPTRDIFKNFKVSRKMKNLKITAGNLGKGETKSCEFLDETEHVSTNRCSKSVECLEDQFDEFDGDLSIEFNDDAVAALALPQEIVDIILRGREQLNKIRLKETQVECDYMPMSPIVPPPPIEHHYMVMSPKTNLARVP